MKLLSSALFAQLAGIVQSVLHVVAVVFVTCVISMYVPIAQI